MLEWRQRLVNGSSSVEGLRSPAPRAGATASGSSAASAAGASSSAGNLGTAPDGTERLAFGALDFGGVGATAALEVEVLADRVVQYAHAVKPTPPPKRPWLASQR